MGTLFVSEIWRYPVKSMAGEALSETEVGLSGIPGDRVVQVFKGSGRIVTARTHPALLGHHATLASDGEPLVATDGAIAAFGRDRRRLRPNLVIGGVTGLDERRWPGGRLRIGEVVIEVDSLRGRCVMTTVDPDTLEQDPRVLRDIVDRFGGRLALNCDVLRGGMIRLGQAVELVETTESEVLSYQID